MTERKPAELSVETWVDRQIREASERGEFNNLPGQGKPLPGRNRPDDDMWWIRGFLAREGISGSEVLPTPLLLRREIEQLPETAAGLHSEEAVRGLVTDLNRRIVEWLRRPTGPQIRVGPVDIEQAVADWKAARQNSVEPPAPDSSPDEAANQPDRVSWWRRLFRRRD